MRGWAHNYEVLRGNECGGAGSTETEEWLVGYGPICAKSMAEVVE